MTLIDHVLQEPLWLQAWMFTLVIVNGASFIFGFFDRRAHWVLTATLAVMVLMPELFDIYGYSRILGLTHILFWTPLLIYLWRNRQPNDHRTWAGRYLYTVLAIDGISLVIDYIDLARFLMGDGDLT